MMEIASFIARVVFALLVLAAFVIVGIGAISAESAPLRLRRSGCPVIMAAMAARGYDAATVRAYVNANGVQAAVNMARSLGATASQTQGRAVLPRSVTANIKSRPGRTAFTLN